MTAITGSSAFADDDRRMPPGAEDHTLFPSYPALSVIPREGGVSSMPRLLRSKRMTAITGSSAFADDDRRMPPGAEDHTLFPSSPAVSVIPREGGVSSTPRLLRSKRMTAITGSSAFAEDDRRMPPGAEDHTLFPSYPRCFRHTSR